MAPPSHPEIDEAASQYVECRDARMAALEEEVKAHDVLLQLMKKHGLKNYEFEANVVSVVTDAKEKVKVNRKKAESNGDDSED